MDKSGIMTFRPRVVSVIRKKVATGHRQKEYKEKGHFVSNLKANSGPDHETSSIDRMLSNRQEELRKSRKVGRRVVIADEPKVVTEDNLEEVLEVRNKNKEIVHGFKEEAVVPGVKQTEKFSVALSKESKDFISRGGRHDKYVIRKIEQMTGASIGRALIRGSEEAVMKAKYIIEKEEVILQKNQVTFLLWNGGKRVKSIEEDSNALIMIKGKFEDDMRPVTFIGTELAVTIGKAILVESAIIQTKIILDSEVGLLLRDGAKLITRIQREADVYVEFKGKRGDKGRAIDVIGSKEAVAKAWALIKYAMNKF